MIDETLQKIKSRGYWVIIIRPTEYKEERGLGLRELKDIVRKESVLLRGWDFPHLDQRNSPEFLQSYVQQSIDWSDHIELWRLYLSGQFICIRAFQEDWRESAETFTGPLSPYPAPCLSVRGVVYLVTEAFEFASRLSAQNVLGTVCSVRVILASTEGRTLLFSDPVLSVPGEFKCTIKRIGYEKRHQVLLLQAKARELARHYIKEIFLRFGWENPSDAYIKVMQEDLFRLKR